MHDFGTCKAFSLQVLKSCTDLDPTLLYISTLETHRKFVRKNKMLALGVCLPQPGLSAGRWFAVSRSRLNYYEQFVSWWYERCLSITESPKTPCHSRYLIWVLVYIPYTGLAVFSFAICSCSCVYCDFEFVKFVFSTLQSRSCWQLTNFCLLRGLKG